MPALRRIVFLLVIAGFSCKRGPRVCPEGMDVIAEKSVPGKHLWCKSKDGSRATWTEYHTGTDRKHTCRYAAGRPEGSFASWHPGGKPWVSGEYREGVKVGKWSQLDKDGFKVAEGEYRSGEFVAGAPVGIAGRCEQSKP